MNSSFPENVSNESSNFTTISNSSDEEITNNTSTEINNSSGITADKKASYGNGVSDDLTNPIKFDYLKNILIFPADELNNLPSYYDLRQLGRVTPIKDQGPLGVCWSFAAIGSLESTLLPGNSWSFSENNMKNLLSNTYPDGFDRTYSGGGDWLAALAYLVRYSGPVLSSLDPYNTNSGISPPGLTPAVHVQECVIIPPRSNFLDNAQYKRAIMKYGAVDTALAVYDYPFYNKNTYSFYYDKGDDPFHAVCLVGWDDNFDKSNFVITPPGNGAFIVRNSWGSNVDDGGYFYISYYDTSLATRGGLVFTNTGPNTNYNHIYQYDPLGAVGLTGFQSTTAWFSNIFTSDSANPLAATSFYALSPNSQYSLFVYLNPHNGNPTSGTLVYSKNGIISTPGYKTIPFDKYVPLKIGQKFSVVVKITSPYLDTPIAYEYPLLDYSSKAKANFGESFISPNGLSWMDMAKMVNNANVCLKAFTVSASNLVISQHIINNNPHIHDLIYLTIKIFNQGPQNALEVKIYHKLPVGLRFLSYYTNYGAYNSKTGVWNIKILPYKSTAILIIKCQAIKLGSFNSIAKVSSSTYNSMHKISILNIKIKPEKQFENNSVNAVTIPLENTGVPVLPLTSAVLLIISALLVSNKKNEL